MARMSTGQVDRAAESIPARVRQSRVGHGLGCEPLVGHRKRPFHIDGNERDTRD